jgi:hydroxypyruvate reductase
MKRTPEQLREDALAIWRAAVAAVDSRRLVMENLRVEGDTLTAGDREFDLRDVERIVVVGAGKAGSGMAEGVEQALGPEVMQSKQLEGWVNVPADCVRPLSRIKLHAARPAGVNEPTPEGVAGAEAILRLVESLQENDLCLCLISGGGSALLPAPVEGVSLADKQAVTRFLSGAGANIQQLNTVRKQLSRIKGGGLARACRGRLVSLIVSDVIGDPLDIIASGPTVEDTATPADALAVLDRFGGVGAAAPEAVYQHLRRKSQSRETLRMHSAEVANLVIGNNAVAVDAAGMEAERRGYSHAMTAATDLEGAAEDVGRHLARMALRMRDQSGPDCLITGGEPVVQLIAEAERGRGGRNQQLVLAALDELLAAGDWLEGIALLSGGTDGEDGPTDAAGAVIDAATPPGLRKKQLNPSEFLRRNDAYTFFEAVDGLIKTGPTHTNVCDVRVVVVSQP